MAKKSEILDILEGTESQESQVAGSYPVLGRVAHDGLAYGQGDAIAGSDISEAQAEQLIALGVLGAFVAEG